MTSGCARICSPWKPNSSTSVASSATSDSGCKPREQSRRAPPRRPAPAARRAELRDDHRHDDVEHDREEQRVPRHGDRRQAEQQPDDRREGDDHDGVVERHLAQREMRLALGQSWLQTNTIAVQGAAARMISPAM